MSTRDLPKLFRNLCKISVKMLTKIRYSQWNLNVSTNSKLLCIRLSLDRYADGWEMKRKPIRCQGSGFSLKMSPVCDRGDGKHSYSEQLCGAFTVNLADRVWKVIRVCIIVGKQTQNAVWISVTVAEPVLKQTQTKVGCVNIDKHAL